MPANATDCHPTSFFYAVTIWLGGLCTKFGATDTRCLKRKRRGYGDTFYIDEVFVRINGKQQYLWGAVGRVGEVVNVYRKVRRDRVAAKWLFTRLLKSHGDELRKIATDRLRNNAVATRYLIPDRVHSAQSYESNRMEQSQSLARLENRPLRSIEVNLPIPVSAQ